MIVKTCIKNYNNQRRDLYDLLGHIFRLKRSILLNLKHFIIF